MILARIVGTVVATRKDERLHGAKLLVARTVDPHGKDEASYLVAVDTVDAGVGDRVLVVDEGNSAALVLRRPRGAVRTVVVGVIDDIESPPARSG